MTKDAFRCPRCLPDVVLIVCSVLVTVAVMGGFVGASVSKLNWQAISGAAMEIAGEVISITAPARLAGARAAGIAQAFEVVRKRGIVSFEARGEGNVGMAVWGRGGIASYGPTVALTDQWQTIQFDYYFEGIESISIYSESGYATKFHLRNFQIISGVQPELYDREIEGVSFEAEDYPAVNGRITKVADASGGAAMWGKRWYVVTRLPAPMTSRPLYYFLRVKSSTDKEITASLRNGYQRVAQGETRDADEWKWLRIGPVDAAAVYPAVEIQYGTDPETEILLDRVVITTNPHPQDLDEEVKPLSIAVSGRVRIGRGDEATPENSIAVGPFMLNQTSKLASEQTVVRFAYNDTHLFVTFRCWESALNPVENRLHEFKSQVTADDDTNIYNDDCVLLLIKPDPEADAAYDFVANATGALLDARSTAPDYWGSRNFEWNSGAKVTTSRDEQGWTVSLAIPFESLGFSPEPGARLYVMAGRMQAARKEASSWQVLSRGFHENTFGELIFDEGVPALAVTELPAFTPGTNRLAFNQPVAVEINTRQGNELRRQFYVGTEAQFVVPEGELDFQFRAARPGDLALYYESPFRKVHASAMALVFEPGRDVILNGVRVSSGAPLNWGVNTLRADGGEFRVGDFTFRHPGGDMILLAGHTQIWPNWEEAGGVTVSRGGLQQLLVRPLGVPGHMLRDYTLYFELPADYTVEGASGYYGTWPLKVETDGEVVRHGKKYVRHAVRFEAGVPHDPAFSEPLYRHVAFVFRAPLEAEVGDPIYYYCGSERSKVVEIPQKLQVRLLPPLDGRQPERLIVQLWTGWLTSMDDKELLAKYHLEFEKMGVNECPESSNPNVRSFVLINFETWNFDLRPYISSNIRDRLVDLSGQRSGTYVCTTAMLERAAFDEYLRKQMPEWYERRGRPDHVNWDYESEVTKSYISCFCPLCLERFRAFAGLDSVPERSEIPSRYMAEWTRFMNMRMAELAGKLRSALKACNENVRFSVYSGYQSETHKRVYGVDWSLLADKIDVAMAGYGRPIDELNATRTALGKTPLVLGHIAYPYDVKQRTAPTYLSAATLLRRAADSTGGILMYSLETLDSRTFNSVAAVSKIMAEYEEFFLTGDRRGDEMSVPGWERDDYEVLVDPSGNRLLLLMNTGKTVRKYGDHEIPPDGALAIRL